MFNSPKLDIVNINSYIKFGEILSICSQDIERKQNSGVNQGPIFWYKCAKIMCNNPNLDLVNMNAYIKFDENLSRTSDTLIGYLPIFQMLPKFSLCIRYRWYSFEKEA